MKLALAQMRVEGENVSGNLLRAERAIADAAAKGADLVLLPEALDCGWAHPCARHLAQPVPAGATCERLCRAAAKAQIYVCAGLVERAENVLFNAAILVSPEGRIMLHHRKIHELDIAADLYTAGDRLSIAETPLFGRLGVMICADAFAPEFCVSRTLGAMGAKLILSPCAWAVASDHDQAREPYGDLWRGCYGPVAHEFDLWIAGASNVGQITAGPWSGRKCIGCSLVVSPEGLPVLQGPYGEDAEALLLLDLDNP